MNIELLQNLKTVNLTYFNTRKQTDFEILDLYPFYENRGLIYGKPRIEQTLANISCLIKNSLNKRASIRDQNFKFTTRRFFHATYTKITVASNLYSGVCMLFYRREKDKSKQQLIVEF